MHGLTQLGLRHTLISLAAVVAAAIAFARDMGVDPANTLGALYLRTVILACLTGLGNFKHGGFGKPPEPGIAALRRQLRAPRDRRGVAGAAVQGAPKIAAALCDCIPVDAKNIFLCHHVR